MMNPLSILTQATQSAMETRTDAGGRTSRSASSVNGGRVSSASATGAGSSGAASASSAESSASGSAGSGIVPAGAAMKETFLMLLVAQIKNQNPLNPADGTEFLSQLAQFTQVEQLISIREELETLARQNQALSEAAASSFSAH
ncbi:MAG: hypothetical protein KIT83_03060 [Bryobacterales bacterium]|nr:hypothetical protein [Bryobacterales bacterium]